MRQRKNCFLLILVIIYLLYVFLHLFIVLNAQAMILLTHKQMGLGDFLALSGDPYAENEKQQYYALSFGKAYKLFPWESPFLLSRDYRTAVESSCSIDSRDSVQMKEENEDAFYTRLDSGRLAVISTEDAGSFSKEDFQLAVRFCDKYGYIDGCRLSFMRYKNHCILFSAGIPYIFRDNDIKPLVPADIGEYMIEEVYFI